MESTLLGVGLDPLGDGISKVTCLNLMGDDLTVVNAARVSFSKTSYWHDDDELKEQDAKLIKYLAAHKHWTPFSQPHIQFRIKMPIFVARQWYTHTVGFTRNEESRRYISKEPQCYVPTEWRKAAENVKQGSSEELVDVEHDVVSWYYKRAVTLYNTMIDSEICAEQARMILPQSMYTEFVEVGSLAAYARLYSLRSSKEAQKEVRLYAEAVGRVMRASFPYSWAALTEA
jgi:thymidylate synthase (FAD)